MPEPAPAGATAPEFTRHAAGAAFACCVGYLVGPTAVIGPPLGLFLVPVSHHFGLSRSGLSLILCMVALLVAVTAPLAGRLIDRYGARRVVLPAVLAFGCAEAGLGLSGHSLWLYTAAYALVGVLAGIQNPIAYSKVVSLWFSRHRGLVLALAGAVGGGGGGVLVPQLADALIRRGGWQFGYIGLGGFVIVVGMPVLVLFLREPRQAAAGRTILHGMPTNLPGVSRGVAMGTLTFWMVLTIVTLAAGSVMAVSVHLPALLADRAAGSHLPALFLSVFALGSVVGQFLTGAGLDRINSPKVGAPFFAVAALGALLLWRARASPDTVLLGGLLTGSGFGAELGLACYYISRFFGLRSYGEIYGAVYGTTVAASAIGPFLVGYSFDRFGSYDPALAVITCALGACMALVLLLPPYRFASQRAAAAAQAGLTVDVI
jgi:MFS family permease